MILEPLPLPPRDGDDLDWFAELDADIEILPQVVASRADTYPSNPPPSDERTTP